MAKGNNKGVTVTLEQLQAFAKATEVKAPEVKENIPAKPLLLRTVTAARWKELFQLYLDGVTLPRPIIGTYPSDDGKETFHIVVDGMHRITAIEHMAQLLDDEKEGTLSEADKEYMGNLTEEERERMESLIENIPVTMTPYDSLAGALIDQLDHNSGGSKMATEVERDARIRYLVNVLGTPLKEVADKVHLTEGSVSRIARNLQNKSGTYKGGRKKGSRTSGAQILGMKPLFKALENIRATVQNDQGKRELNAYATADVHMNALRETAALLVETAEWLEEQHSVTSKKGKEKSETVAA